MESLKFYLQSLSPTESGFLVFLAFGLVFVLFLLIKKIRVRIRFRKQIKTLGRQILYFTKEEIDRRVKHYIWPDCQSIDPQSRNQEGRIAEVRNDIRNTMDQLLFREDSVKHIYVMAAGGMGKTSFLLNYYSLLNHKRMKKYQVELIPMNLKNVYKRLKEIEDPANTILLLDGYDEIIDTQHSNLSRLHTVMENTQHFFKVIISCHVQSIPKDNIIPKLIAQKSKRFTSPLEKEYWSFIKIYLSGFNNQQIVKYIKKRFKPGKRKAAFQITEELPNLAIRPLYLEYIEDLSHAFMSLHNSYQVYNEIFEAWLNNRWNRELHITKNNLHDFMLLLALKMYTNREVWQDDYIPSKEIKNLAQQFSIDLSTWKLKESFFLNSDEVGNHTFAHRSIVDFLFAKNILLNNAEALHVPESHWSNAVIQFVCEGLRQKLWYVPYLFVKIENAIIRSKSTKKMQKLQPFEIARRVVTNQEYEEFEPGHRLKRNTYSSHDEQPVVYVSWADAMRYCEWLSKKSGQTYRLPTESEWEYVAGEGGKRFFPWGNEKPTAEFANYDETRISRTTEVCSFPKGKTPQGIYDLAGNVWEWCADYNKRKDKIRIIKGGSFGLPENSITVDTRIEFNANLRVANVGFRLVREI